eukprot:1003196_1
MYVTRANEKPRPTMTTTTRGLSYTNVYLIGRWYCDRRSGCGRGWILYLSEWFSESTLIDQNRQLMYQNQSYKADINQLQEQIDVYKAHDLKERDGTIQALEEVNNKYLTDLKSANAKVNELELKVSEVEDLVAYKEEANIKINALQQEA